MNATDASAAKKIMRAVLVALVSAFAFFMAMLSVPAISESSGISSGYVSIILAGTAFVLTIAATRWTRSPNRKQTRSDGNA